MERTSTYRTVHRNNMLRTILDNKLKDLNQRRARAAAELTEEMIHWRESGKDIPRSTGHHTMKRRDNPIRYIARELSSYSFLATPGPGDQPNKMKKKRKKERQRQLENERESLPPIGILSQKLNNGDPERPQKQVSILMPNKQNNGELPQIEEKSEEEEREEGEEELLKVADEQGEIDFDPEKDVDQEIYSDTGDDLSSEFEEAIPQWLRKEKVPTASSLRRDHAKNNYMSECRYGKPNRLGKKMSCPVTSAAMEELRKRHVVERVKTFASFGRNNTIVDNTELLMFGLSHGQNRRYNMTELNMNVGRKLAIALDRRSLRLQMESLILHEEEAGRMAKLPKPMKSGKFTSKINALFPNERRPTNFNGNNGHFSLPSLV